MNNFVDVKKYYIRILVNMNCFVKFNLSVFNDMPTNG